MDSLIIFFAEYLLFLIILLAIIIVFKAKRKTQKYLAKLALIAFPLAYILTKISAHFINDPRPFVVDHVKPLIAHAADNGFPSDHTMLSLTIAALIFIYNKRLGIFLGILGLLVGFARVVSKLHHIEDIVGSCIIAILAIFIAWHITKRITWFNS
jgi:undecaprenyl-diphosphatase